MVLDTGEKVYFSDKDYNPEPTDDAWEGAHYPDFEMDMVYGGRGLVRCTICARLQGRTV